MTEYITTAEAAADLGLSPMRIRQLIHDGTLRATKFGHVYMITRRDLAGVVRRPPGRPPRRLSLPTSEIPAGKDFPEMHGPGAR